MLLSSKDDGVCEVKERMKNEGEMMQVLPPMSVVTVESRGTTRAVRQVRNRISVTNARYISY
jgi:hypothetical protein